MPDTTGTFELPEADDVKTRASGEQELGDVELGLRDVTETLPRGQKRRGPRVVVFRSVSYPIVAVETIRSVARGKRLC
jgi:hypothetical protein